MRSPIRPHRSLWTSSLWTNCRAALLRSALPVGLLLMLLAVWGGAAATARAEEGDCPTPLRVGSVPDWPPYQILNRHDILTGIDNDTVRTLMADIGCPVEILAIGWPRVLTMLEKGAIEMMSGTSYTPQRAEYAHFSAPYRREVLVLYVRKGQSDLYPLTRLEDIERLRFRLAVTAGSYYGPEFTTLMERPGFKALVTEVQGNETPALVSIGRVDGYLLDVNAADAYINAPDRPLPLERHPGITIDNGPIHFMFSRQRVSPAFVERLNAAILRRQ